MRSSRNAVVLDFDGTIADAEEVMLKVYEPLAKQYDWPKLTRSEYYRLKKGSPREIMKWANIKFWQLPRLLKIGRAEYKKHAAEIKLFAGMSKILDQLAESSDVYILSSNDSATVRSILSGNKLKAKVTILRGSTLFGKDKALKKLLKDRYAAGESWMIGDEIRDIEAGKKARMQTIGVAWGLQSAAGIKRADPDFIAKKPDDILKFIYNKV